MTGETESQSGSAGDRPTSRIGAALWGSLCGGRPRGAVRADASVTVGPSAATCPAGSW